MVEKLVGYVEPETVNKYELELVDIHIGDIFHETVQTRVSENTGKTLGLAGTKSKIQAAARVNGFTARLIEEKDLGGGKVDLIFKAYPVQKSGPRGPRKPKDGTPVE